MKGFIDNVRGNFVEGWLWSGTEKKCVVEAIRANGKLINISVADLFRKDVFDAGFGDGFCGFRIEIPAEEFDSYCIIIRDLESKFELIGSPLEPKKKFGLGLDIDAHYNKILNIISDSRDRRSMIYNIYNNIKNIEHDFYHKTSNSFDESDSVRDIVILPPIDWSYREQRPQHLARAFSDLGCKILYISTEFIASEAEDMNFVLKSIPYKNVAHVKLSRPTPHLPINITAFSQKELGHITNSLSRCILALGFFQPIFIVGSPAWGKLAQICQAILSTTVWIYIDTLALRLQNLKLKKKILLILHLL